MPTKETQKLIQSWDDLFPPEVVTEYNLDSPEARAEYFMDLWFEWEKTSITLKPELYNIPSMYVRYEALRTVDIVRNFAKKHNLKEFWDYQVRGKEVRFKDEDTALLFRLIL